MPLLTCYNRGCGKEFDPETDNKNSCQHHPGVPVFHDAMKGWSCCDKRRRDFTEFLDLPGCSFGEHTNVKPKEPEAPQPKEEPDIVEPPKVNKPLEPPKERPSENEAMVRLGVTIGASLQQLLDKQMKEMSVQDDSKTDAEITNIEIGTSCKNSGCRQSYEGEHTNTEKCLYHPGTPVFHEGMKYWSCCQRKTSDFDNFLDQAGCTHSRHAWIKKEAPGEKVCRYDWFQTASMVTLSVFSKATVPEQSFIEVNRVKCHVHIVYDGGASQFEQKFILRGAIDPTNSHVKMLGTKVEISLKKGEPLQWPTLEYKS